VAGRVLVIGVAWMGKAGGWIGEAESESGEEDLVED
jgi:hypothetical protein